MSLLHIGGSSGASSVVPAEGVDFDDVNDYLSRSTDLVGNVDSKTFTFSCWVYKSSNNTNTVSKIFSSDTGGTFHVVIQGNSLQILGYNLTEDGYVLNLQATSATNIPLNTYSNVLVSLDLSSSATRHVYINDVASSSLNFSTYINAPLNFTCTKYGIGGNTNGSGLTKIRLSNLFLDYTYRDLSIEANRRLFITADGKPTPTATLKALNPILYLPMKDASTAHINEGTGGNFTLNGTIATSNRGANQDNCKASYLDGTADYLSRTSLTGVSACDAVTISFINKNANTNGGQIGFGISTTTNRFYVTYNGYTISVFGSDNTEATKVSITYTFGALNINSHISISIDTSDITKCKIFVNGVNSTLDSKTVSTGNIDFSSCSTFNIGKKVNSNTFHQGNIGELYFDTKYIDLSTSNPFWDKDTNRPKPVRQVIRETGITPLIAMPLDASNAGKNYGTGGDFTANSAPYVGARGGSEFWARSAFVTDTTTSNKLSLAHPIPVAPAYFTGVISFRNLDTNANSAVLGFNGSSGINIRYNGGGSLTIFRGDTTIITLTSQTYSTNWATFYFSIDLLTDLNYLRNSNGQISTTTVNTVRQNSITGLDLWLLNRYANNYVNSNMASCYLTTDYIDFSQEVNRLKFVDGLGYPLDLAKQIDAGIIPNPLIYLPFNDPSNLGLNLGTGGNFTVNGTVTQGADVNG